MSYETDLPLCSPAPRWAVIGSYAATRRAARQSGRSDRNQTRDGNGGTFGRICHQVLTDSSSLSTSERPHMAFPSLARGESPKQEKNQGCSKLRFTMRGGRRALLLRESWRGCG